MRGSAGPLRKTVREPRRRYLREANQFASFAGRRVLEIGSNERGIEAEEMLRLGAASVAGVNLTLPEESRRLGDGITLWRADVRSLPFDDESFDLVFGCAVLEHLNDLEQCWREVARVLKPSGRCYLQGSPLWPGRAGHHLWVRGEAGWYTFTRNNPLPDWGHLLLSRSEMSAYLSETIGRHDAQLISDWVHDTSAINRKSAKEMLASFADSELVIQDHQVDYAAEAEEPVASDLRRRGWLPETYRAHSLTVFAQKRG